MRHRGEDLPAARLDLARHHEHPADLEADEGLLRERQHLAAEGRPERFDDLRVRIGAGQRLELDLRHEAYQGLGREGEGGDQAVHQQRGGRHVPGLDAEVGRLLGVPARGLGVTGQAEVPGQLGHGRLRPPLQRPARPQVHGTPLLGRDGVVHGVAGQRMAERPLPGPALAQQPAVEHFGRLRGEPLLGQAADRAQGRVVGRAGHHRHRVQDGAGVGPDPPDAFEHGVADRGRDVDAVQPPTRPSAVLADQVGPVVHQPHRLLNRQRYALGACVQEVRELGGDVPAGQHRRDERGGLADVQRIQRQPDQVRVGRGPGEQPQQQ